MVTSAALLGWMAARPAPAVEVVQDQIYPGDTRLEASELGVAFTVPSGWRGVWPGGSEGFVLQPESDPAVHILALGEEGTRAELAAMMGAPVDLGEGFSLDPTGAVTERGQVLIGRYRVRGGASELSAYAEALAGEHGVAIAYVLIAPSELLARHETTVGALVASTRLEAPGGGAPSAGASTAEGADRWDTYLRGKHVVRLYSGSNYTEEEHIWLCSDGTFQRTSNSGGYGGGASGAFQGGGAGRWTATGAGATGALTLHWPDGSTSRYDLRWDYEENHLYVDGKRWFHDQNEVCR